MKYINNFYIIFVETLKGRALGRPKRKWEDNTKMDIGETGCGASGSGQCPVEGFCEHGNEP